MVSLLALRDAQPREPLALSSVSEGAPMTPDWFVNWARFEMRRQGLSRRGLAKLAGVDHSGITRLFDGTRTPQLTYAMKLAAGLGYTLTVVPGPPDYYR